MGELVDWNDEKDPRVIQHRIRQRREQHDQEQAGKAHGVGLLRGFTDEQLLDELERRHPDALDGSGSPEYSQGSGSYKYNDPVDWIKTEGAGVTDNTSLNPNLEPTRANSITTTILQPGTLPTQQQTTVVVDDAWREREQRAAEADAANAELKKQQAEGTVALNKNGLTDVQV